VNKNCAFVIPASGARWARNPLSEWTRASGVDSVPAKAGITACGNDSHRYRQFIRDLVSRPLERDILVARRTPSAGGVVKLTAALRSAVAAGVHFATPAQEPDISCRHLK
jgi:hypothetical protein